MFQNAVDFNSIKPEPVEKEIETELEEEEEEEEKEEEEDPLVRRLVRFNLLRSPLQVFFSFFNPSSLAVILPFPLSLFLSLFPSLSLALSYTYL